jgi:eukaryotic-like serine/threonine-protein kinase
MICPRCGSPDETKRFCRRCGLELQATLVADAPIALGEAPRPRLMTPTALHQGEAAGHLIGRTIDQRYYIEARIGSGGMGTVYRARRLLIGDTVAVKVLHPEQLADSSAVERFRREAQAAARLKHPNVVAIYDFGVAQEGLIYLVMELVEGESLRQVIERQGTLIPAAATEVARQVCAALDETHQQGVVHRDIKPENILLQTTPSELRVKVLDFGIAALRDITASRLTRTGGVAGTPHYMSPEQCMGEELDGRSDIYSFGIILYETLTGAVPFDSPTTTAIVVQHVNQPPPPMRSLNANISPEVEAVVLHALEKQREARPQTAGALARELMAAVSGGASAPTQPATPIAGATSTPEPAPAEATTPLWERGAAAAQISEPSFGNIEPASNTRGKLAPLLFGMLLLLALGGGLGYWWYANKGNTEQAAATAPAPASNQQPSTAASDRNMPGSGVGPASETKPMPSSGKLWELISDQTSGVSEDKNALGAPDQQVAVIAPGGQLALAYLGGLFFGDGTGADLRMFGPEQGRVSYTVFVRDDPASAWRRIDINRRGFPQGGAGHDMGHHGVRQARQLMIRNDANTDLRLDAVTVVYKDTVTSKGSPHRHR